MKTKKQNQPSTLDAQTAQKALAADLGNVLKKIRAGQTLSRWQRTILEQHLAAKKGAGVAPAAAPAFAASFSQLAAVLNTSRQRLAWHAKKTNAPRPAADGRHNVEAWRDFLATNGRSLPAEGTDLAAEKLRGEQLSNWRKEFRNAALQKQYVPVDVVRSVCAQALQAMKTRMFSGLPRLTTLVRLAKSDEDALSAARAEMISTLRVLEAGQWFKPSEAQPATH